MISRYIKHTNGCYQFQLICRMQFWVIKVNSENVGYYVPSLLPKQQQFCYPNRFSNLLWNFVFLKWEKVELPFPNNIILLNKN